jgi:hypothetical protein
MKRLLLSVAVAAIGFAAVPSHAVQSAMPACGGQGNLSAAILGPGYNGTDGDGAPKPDEYCTFTSNGGAIQYVIATPNHWSIVASHVDPQGHEVIDAYAGADTASTAQGPGTLNGALKGDKVVVTQGSDCEVICGQGGLVIAVQQ